MAINLIQYPKNYFIQPLDNGKKQPISSIEMSLYYDNNPKSFGTVLYDEVTDSIFSELMAKGNEFYFKADQVIWQEQQQGVNPNIVSGNGAVSASFAGTAPFAGTFTINAAALPADAFDINSDRPTTPKWLQVKLGMEFTVFDSTGRKADGRITAIAPDKSTFTASPKGGSWNSLGTTNLTVLFNGNNLDHCELAPCIGYEGYKPARENTMFKDSECVKYCEETEAVNGRDGGDAELFTIGSDEYNLDYRLNEAQKTLTQRMENAFVFNKRLTTAEAGQGQRGTEGVIPILEGRATKFGKIENKADLMKLFANMRVKKIKFATLRCSAEQYDLLLNILDSTNMTDPFKDTTNELIQIGFDGFKHGQETILFKRWDLLDYYPNLGKRYHWILIPDGKLRVKFDKSGREVMAGYLNIGWFQTDTKAYKFYRKVKGNDGTNSYDHDNYTVHYVNKMMPIVLRPEDWMLGLTIPA